MPPEGAGDRREACALPALAAAGDMCSGIMPRKSAAVADGAGERCSRGILRALLLPLLESAGLAVVETLSAVRSPAHGRCVQCLCG